MPVGYPAVARMSREHGAILGRTVDMRPEAELYPAFRCEVAWDARPEYEAA